MTKGRTSAYTIVGAALLVAATSTHASAVQLPGDFDGNGHSDTANIIQDVGGGAIARITFGYSQGTNRLESYPLMGNYWRAQHWCAGDFSGDGKTDLVVVYNKDGRPRIWVQASTGHGFRNKKQSLKEGIRYFDGQTWSLQDRNGDGRADLVLEYQHPRGRRRMVFPSVGGGFAPNWIRTVGDGFGFK